MRRAFICYILITITSLFNLNNNHANHDRNNRCRNGDIMYVFV